jgi:hypothetical protein
VYIGNLNIKRLLVGKTPLHWVRDKHIENNESSGASLKKTTTYPLSQEGKGNLHSNVLLELRNSKSKKIVQLQELEEPIFLIMFNRESDHWVKNFVCNMQLFPASMHRLLIVSSNKTIQEQIENLTMTSEMSFTTGIMSYDAIEYTNIIDRYVLFESKSPFMENVLLLNHVIGTKNILWISPGATVLTDLMQQIDIATKNPGSDIMLYQYNFTFSHDLIRFSASYEVKRFYTHFVHGINSGLDVSVSMATALSKTNIKISYFDTCLYRNGFEKESVQNSSLCKSKEIVMQLQHIELYLHEFIGGQNWKCATRDMRIIVLTMNRYDSLQRLLYSLHNIKTSSDYPYIHPKQVDLQINIDASPHDDDIDASILNLVSTFEWTHGLKQINKAEKNLGIQTQWIDSYPCELYNEDTYHAILFLEDDTEVSPLCVQWFLGAHHAFNSDNIGTITGMRPQLVADTKETRTIHKIITDLSPNHSTFPIAYKLIGTWGLSPKPIVWKLFRKWYMHKRLDPSFQPLVQGIIPSVWYESFLEQGTQDSMWEMWLVRYTYDHDLYTIYPWIDNGKYSFVTGWKERGLHYDGKDVSPDFPLAELWNEDIISERRLIYI